MTAWALTTTFEVLSALFAGLTAMRIWHDGLQRRYPFLAAYLIFLTPYSAFPAILDNRSRAYFWSWIVCEPFNWAFEILVVRELCGLVLERYQGLRSLGRWVMYCGVAVSAAVSVISLLPRIPSAISHRSRLLPYWFGANRGIHLALGIFLLLMLLIAGRYPLRLSRNIILNAWMFAMLFFGSTLASLLQTVFDLKVAVPLDLALTGASAASLIIWFFALTPKGEWNPEKSAPVPVREEEHVLRVLGQIDHFVLRLRNASS